MTKLQMCGWRWGAAVGLLVALASLEVWDAVRYVQKLPMHNLAGVAPLPLADVANPPATVQSGQPQFRGAHYAQAPGKGSGSGVWACDGPSTFEWNFGSDEVVYLIDGEVQVTYLGKQFTIRPGDTSLFLQGTSAVWHVPKGLLKSYTLHHPPLLVRWWRKWSAR
jgi:uncharacterized protein